MVNLTEISTEDNICVVCNLNAPHKCSGCKQVYYCSRDHQKQHWKTHKAQCRAIEVKSSPDLGRFLVASRDVDESDILFIESPLVFGPKLMSPTPMCLGCYRPLQPKVTATCVSCMWPACDRSCPGLTDPRHHALECLVLSLSPLTPNEYKFPRYEIISPLRTLLLQKRNPNKWQQILSMEAHMNKRGPKTYAYQYLEEKVTVFLMERYLSKLDQNALPESSKEIIHRICGIFEVNALEVCFGGSMNLLALYSNACTMEHNCMPNTVHHFDSELRITVRTARKIFKNDHLNTMYTNILWGTQARRDHLKETKYFDCKCQRCKDPTELGSYISALKCHGDDEIPCNGWQLPLNPLDYNSDWKCNVCPMMLTFEEEKSLEDMLEQEVETVKKMDNVTVDKVNEILNTLEKFLHPNHYHCYEMKHLLIQLYGNKPGFSHKKLTNAELKRKIEICRDLLSVSGVIDPSYGHLTLYVAVLMFELHSALLEMDSRMKTENHQEIEVLLRKTMEILKHEPSNTPGSELRRLSEKSLADVRLKK